MSAHCSFVIAHITLRMWGECMAGGLDVEVRSLEQCRYSHITRIRWSVQLCTKWVDGISKYTIYTTTSITDIVKHRHYSSRSNTKVYYTPWFGIDWFYTTHHSANRFGLSIVPDNIIFWTCEISFDSTYKTF